MAPNKGGGNPRSIPEGKSQANFNIPDDLLEKVKDLGHLEGVANTEIYVRAIERYIQQYEAKHGKIKPRPKGKGLL